MNTFNNLPVDTVAKMIKSAASIGIVMPTMNRADARKCKAFKTAILSAIDSAEYHAANGPHYVRSNEGMVCKDRIGSLANAIARFSKLNPGVLKGGQRLKDALIECAWLAYAKLEVQGLDNAHFQQTNLPADGRRDAPYQLVKRVDRILPDSKYPGSEWALLETADLFENQRRDITPKPLGLTAHTPCKASASPTVPHTPEWFGGIPAEPMQGGHGSGLPFTPKARPMPSEDRLAKLVGQDYTVADRHDRHNWKDYAIHATK